MRGLLADTSMAVALYRANAREREKLKVFRVIPRVNVKMEESICLID